MADEILKRNDAVIQKAVDAAVLAVTTSAKKAADESSAKLQDAIDKTLKEARWLAKLEDSLDAKGFKRQDEDDDIEEFEDDDDERPSFTAADKMTPKARAEAEARYERMVADDEEEEEALTEAQLAQLEDVIEGLDEAVLALAKYYGNNEVIEDMELRRKQTPTTRPRVLEDRPQFRFPDADAGRSASETSDEEGDEVDAKPRVHKSRHRRVSKQRHLGPVFGPRRWQH